MVLLVQTPTLSTSHRMATNQGHCPLVLQVLSWFLVLLMEIIKTSDHSAASTVVPQVIVMDAFGATYVIVSSVQLSRMV
jgi:hypothetical protein